MLSHPICFFGVNRVSSLDKSGLSLGQLLLETSILFLEGLVSHCWGSWCLINESTQWGFGFFLLSLVVRDRGGSGGGFLGVNTPFGGWRRPKEVSLIDSCQIFV